MVKISAADMTRKEEVDNSEVSICRRCGQDIAEAHDNGYCPSFSSSKEVGRWINFSDIYRAIKRELGGRIEVRPSCRTEDTEGPAGNWTSVVGLYRDGEYIGRFDAPYMPEYSMWTDRRGQHAMLYKGWRCALRDLATKTNVRFERFARTLGTTPDRTTEEIRRAIVGYL